MKEFIDAYAAKKQSDKEKIDSYTAFNTGAFLTQAILNSTGKGRMEIQSAVRALIDAGKVTFATDAERHTLEALVDFPPLNEASIRDFKKSIQIGIFRSLGWRVAESVKALVMLRFWKDVATRTLFALLVDPEITALTGGHDNAGGFIGLVNESDFVPDFAKIAITQSIMFVEHDALGANNAIAQYFQHDAQYDVMYARAQLSDNYAREYDLQNLDRQDVKNYFTLKRMDEDIAKTSPDHKDPQYRNLLKNTQPESARQILRDMFVKMTKLPQEMHGQGASVADIQAAQQKLYQDGLTQASLEAQKTVKTVPAPSDAASVKSAADAQKLKEQQAAAAKAEAAKKAAEEAARIEAQKKSEEARRLAEEQRKLEEQKKAVEQTPAQKLSEQVKAEQKRMEEVQEAVEALRQQTEQNAEAARALQEQLKVKREEDQAAKLAAQKKDFDDKAAKLKALEERV